MQTEHFVPFIFLPSQYLTCMMQIVDACQSMEDVEKQLQDIVLDSVMECQKGKPLSHLWSL